MEKQKLKFPEGFLWGAATAAHQVEGGNHNDWSEWERQKCWNLAKNAQKKWADWQQSKFPEMFSPDNYISGRTCDHYNRFQEDFDIAKSLGHNAHRFSIEWSRIEPEEGKFNEKEIEHYRKVLEALRERGLEPFVTLWHWTMPSWVAKKGGCQTKEFIFYFSRFCEYVVEKLRGEVKFWITLNEPTAIISMSYLKGDWLPQKMNPILALRVFKNLVQAHNQAYDVIHKISSEAKVGFSHNMFYYEPNNCKSILDKLIVRIAEYFSNKRFYNMTKDRNDFLCLQYYFHARFKFPGFIRNENKNISDLGWEIYPEGIYQVLKNLKGYNLPIYITENGIADRDDVKRENFIKDHLKWVHKAIAEGVDVRGYFYWSLLDNFEWDKGFWPRFGLVEMDYKTMKRKIRPSAWGYAKIAQNNEIDA